MTTFPISLLVNKLTAELHQSGIEKREAAAQAWLLVVTLSKKNKAQLLTQGFVQLSQEELTQLASWVKAITHQYKPLAYVIGEVPFLDLMLTVRPPTLIPRPETEEWVALLIEQLKKEVCPSSDQLSGIPEAVRPEGAVGSSRRVYPNGSYKPLTILDLCTGTGCIALSLAQAFSQSHVWGIDISEQALVLAQENALRNEISNTTFIVSDLDANLPEDLTFDLIVANPPYILPAEFAELPPHIKEWEDRRALVDEEAGLGVTKRIIEMAARRLRRQAQICTPTLMIEIHYRKGKEVLALMAQHGFTDLVIVKDSAGLDRVVRGFLPTP